MSLAAGSRLGPYEITAPIGAGGMGEVYKARDTRLDRSVAIKVLPLEFSADSDRRARFEREAKTIAGLNHPHICTLHDVGRTDGTTYLVMELLAGETLAERLEKGPLAVEQALGVATDIADALAAAHRQGIVHRDLKPGNVMLTKSGAKLLDFGLAKLTGHGEQPAAASLGSAPTQTRPLTSEGAIVGTLQYMAPEQVEGKPADARTDLWALGAILYEMLTGRRAFEGASAASLIGNIMNSQPPALATLLPLTPPSVDRVVRRCLAKDPEERWQSAADVTDDLRWMRETTSARSTADARPRQGRGWRAAAIAVGGVLLVAIGAGLGWLLRPAPHPAGVLFLNLDPHPAEEVNAGETNVPNAFVPPPGGSRTALAWTPDGRALVFVGRRGGVQRIHVRRLDATEAAALTGTEGAQVPAVSPDGKGVVFWADGALKKVPLAGGPAVKIASNIGAPPVGLAWHPDGTLYFGRDNYAIWKLSANGTLTQVTTPAETESKHGLPHLLPGGRVLLYTVSHQVFTLGDEEIVAQTLSTGQRTLVLRDATDARYVPTGHLVYMRQGVLLAAPFDLQSLKVMGEEVPLLERVAHAVPSPDPRLFTSAGQFAIASTGSLAWLAADLPSPTTKALVAVDRQGHVTPLKAAPVKAYGSRVRLSPDERELAVTVSELRTSALSTFDLVRGTLTPLLQDGEAICPIWTPPDWKHLTFRWTRRGLGSVARYRAEGTSAPELLAGNYWPSSWTPDGRQLAAVDDAGIAIITAESGQATAAPRRFGPKSADYPEFLPTDGRYIAYSASGSERAEVYVAPYPGPGRGIPVSTAGGVAPAWRRDGRALFFIGCEDCTGSGKQRMMEADFQPGAPPRVGTPRQLFAYDASALLFASAAVRGYDVSPDGRQFYAQEFRERNPLPPITQINVALNWFEELKARVPKGR